MRISDWSSDVCSSDLIREPGKGPKPIPLILTHGWPWTFWDMQKVIRPLADPAAYGGDPADAFDVIVPSLPGFTFSTPLPRLGVHAGTDRKSTRLNSSH